MAVITYQCVCNETRNWWVGDLIRNAKERLCDVDGAEINVTCYAVLVDALHISGSVAVFVERLPCG